MPIWVGLEGQVWFLIGIRLISRDAQIFQYLVNWTCLLRKLKSLRSDIESKLYASQSCTFSYLLEVW